MKALSKKSLILVLSLVFALSALMFAYFFKPVKAETEAEAVTPEISHIVVMEQATIRVGKNESLKQQGSGIRFRVQMDAATKAYVEQEEVTLGFLITPKTLLDNAIATAKKEAAEAGSTEEVDITKIDYLTKLVKPDGSLGYVGDDNKGLTAQQSIYLEGEFYYANAAVTGIFSENLELGYTMVAYIKTGETVDKYVLASEDFSRAYKQTASKAYISGKNPLSILQKADDLTGFATEANPIQITEDVDLYKLSETVAQGKTFEGDVFDLTKNLSVKNDFTKIPAEFAGTFKSTENSVKIINGGSALMHVFADETTDANNFKCTHTLFTVTDESVAERTDAENYASALGFVSSEDIKAEMPDADNSINYTGNAVKWNLIETKGWAYCLINPFFTKSELQSMTQYNAVRFTYVASRSLPSYSSSKSDGSPATILSMFSAAGWGTNSIFDFGGHVSSNNATKSQTWETLTIPMHLFLEAYSDDKTVDVIIRQSASSVAGDFYLGDVELVEGPPMLYYDTTYAKLALNKTVPEVAQENGSITEKYTQINFSSTVYGSLPSKENDSTITGSCPEAFKFTRIPTITFTKTTLHSVYAKLMYTADEIEEMAGLVVDENGDPILDENDNRQYTNYQEIKLTYLVDSASAQKLTSVVKGAISVDNYNQWRTDTFSIEEFIQFMGVKEFDVNGVKYTSERLSWHSLAIDSTSTYQRIIAEDFSQQVFLGYFSCAGSASKLYLAGIEFVA